MDKLKADAGGGMSTDGVGARLPADAQHHVTALLVAHRDLIEAQAKGDRISEAAAAARMQQHRTALADGVQGTFNDQPGEPK